MSAVDANATTAGFVSPQLPQPDSTIAGFRSKEDEVPPVLAPPNSDPIVGTMVGKFLIKSVIASGGMGTVFQAMQREPVQRSVALKMIRQGMADESTIKRFVVERQFVTLARRCA